MKELAGNPPNNTLPPGVTESAILAAVSKSGFPLQTRVAAFFRDRLPLRQSYPYLMEEEWSYIDEESSQLRALDLFIETFLHNVTPQPRTTPMLNLLVECKQATLPYVFFASVSRPAWIPNFPCPVGLTSDSIVITSDDDPSSWALPVWECLGLSGEPFISSAPIYCSIFSRCARTGKDLALSGEESYHGIVLPLLKAVKHFRKSVARPSPPFYFDFHAVIPIAVIDAPMIAVHQHEDTCELSLVPWVRILRHEAQERPASPLEAYTTFALDVVHVDFLDEYLTNHLLPFANKFSSMVLKHQEVLASGKAFARGMGADSWHNIEGRLEKARPAAQLRRARAVATRLSRLIRGK